MFKYFCVGALIPVWIHFVSKNKDQFPKKGAF